MRTSAACTASRDYRAAGSFLARFVGGYLLLYVGYLQLPDALLRELVYPRVIIEPAVWLIERIAPGEGAIAAGHRITSDRASLEIVRGCDGVGVMFLLLAALVAGDTRVGHKLLGLPLGIALVGLVNELRVVTLYFVAADHSSWFVLAHAYLSPLLEILCAAGFFAWWRRRHVRAGRAARSASPDG